MNQNIIKILAVVIGATIGLLRYYGAFVNVEANKIQLKSMNFVYFNRVGKYDTVYEDFENAAKEMSSVFKRSAIAGIYYDNPNTTEDPSKERLSIGFFVEESEQAQIETFLSIYPEYQHVLLPSVDSVQLSFPYKNFLSFPIIGMKVYPALNEYLEDNKITPSCVFEIYKFGEGNKSVEFYAPYGKKSEEYILV